RCMCGTCERLMLTACSCSTAEEARETIRKQLAAGETKDQIVLAYVKEYGNDALVVPPNKGGLRAIYAVPLAAFAAGGLGVFALFRRWRAHPDLPAPSGPGEGEKLAARSAKDEYDARLDEELRKLDD